MFFQEAIPCTGFRKMTSGVIHMVPNSMRKGMLIVLTCVCFPCHIIHLSWINSFTQCWLLDPDYRSLRHEVALLVPLMSPTKAIPLMHWGGLCTSPLTKSHSSQTREIIHRFFNTTLPLLSPSPVFGLITQKDDPFGGKSFNFPSCPQGPYSRPSLRLFLEEEPPFLLITSPMLQASGSPTFTNYSFFNQPLILLRLLPFFCSFQSKFLKNNNLYTLHFLHSVLNPLWAGFCPTHRVTSHLITEIQWPCWCLCDI